MKIVLLYFIIVFNAYYPGNCYSSNATDSVGVAAKGSKDYIIHKVTAGETLYSLSRKYGVSVQNIKDANKEIGDALKSGQTVLIPYSELQIPASAKTHIVKSSETLYSISRQYNVAVADLRKWNNLSEDNLSVGQKLIIQNTASAPAEVKVATSGRKTHTVAASQTLYSISKMYGVTTDQIKAWNNLEANNLSVGQVLIISAENVATTTSDKPNSSMLPSSSLPAVQTNESNVAPKAEVTSPLPAEKNEVMDEPGEKIVQKGMAEVIENSTDTKKYLAMHRDAPIGTIMQVRNEMNNQTVFVRVIGTIQPTGDNAKVILKISKKAFDRLGAVDNRFPVEISYLP